MLKVKIIWGTHREETFGKLPAEFVTSVAKQMPEWEVEFINLRDLNIPLEIGSPTPSQANGKYDDPVVTEWAEKIAEADAYVVLTTEYNHGYPGILKNAIDHLYPEWARKPIMFVGYGGELGGGRAIEQLRQVAAELHMVSIREAVYIPYVWQAFNQEGVPVDENLSDKLKGAFTSLTWWGKALQQARNQE